MLIIDVKYKRLDNENEYEYIYRIGKMKDMIGTWQDVADILNTQLGYEYTESKYRKQIQAFEKMFEANLDKLSNVDGYTSELTTLKRDIQVERYKLQTEKLENNRWLREYARDELITEKIVDCINNLAPMKIPDIICKQHSNRSGVLLFGDEHFGTEFQLYGLYGEIINSYDEKTFENRMWDLLSQTVDIVNKEKFSNINVFSLGDYTDGVLRVKQLFTLKYGVIEGSIKYADFITNWLNKLTEYVNVSFQMVNGNHSELRMLGQPKGTFTHENMGLVVYESIKNRLRNNPNFNITKNPSGLIFDNISGFNLLGIHGEVKNMEQAIKDFSSTYNTKIDILVGGHLHHSNSETVGVNRDVINVPSIIGIDGYSLSLHKTSNAGATFIIVEEGHGKVQEYNIKLN